MTPLIRVDCYVFVVLPDFCACGLGDEPIPSLLKVALEVDYV